MVRAAIALLLLVLVPSGASAAGRIALLIGNQSYNAKVGPLKNPLTDIALIGAALEKLGFKTTLIRDGDYRSIDAAIKRHAATVRREGPGTISVLYYSGHGAADPETKINYLIPVDVAGADDADLWINSLNLSKIIEGLSQQAPAATHYVVFDACHNELNLTRNDKKAISDKGFVPLAYTPGVMVAYSTAPGKTAPETGSGGGPYARAFAEAVVKPGVEAMAMFRSVAFRVNREIGQDPWMSASTLPEVYFAGAPSAAYPVAALPAVAQPSEAERAWAAAKDTTSIAVLEVFIARFRGTYYADLARLRVDELEKRQVAMATPAAQILPPQPPQPKGENSAQSRLKIGEKILIGHPSSWNGDCTPQARPTVQVQSKPAFGRVSLENEQHRQEGISNEGSRKCNGTLQKGVAIYYILERDITNAFANDSFLVSIHYRTGRTATLKISVDIANKSYTKTRLYYGPSK